MENCHCGSGPERPQLHRRWNRVSVGGSCRRQRACRDTERLLWVAIRSARSHEIRAEYQGIAQLGSVASNVHRLESIAVRRITSKHNPKLGPSLRWRVLPVAVTVDADDRAHRHRDEHRASPWPRHLGVRLPLRGDGADEPNQSENSSATPMTNTPGFIAIQRDAQQSQIARALTNWG